jgi:hypothetical protein
MANKNPIDNKVPATSTQPLLVGNLDASIAGAVNCTSITSATNNTSLAAHTLSAACSATPVLNSFGNMLFMQMHSSNNTMQQASFLKNSWTAATNGSQTSYWGMNCVVGGAVYLEVLQLFNSGINTNDIGSDPFKYSTGTFTPTVEGTTVAGTANYTYARGSYVKIGNICFFSFCVSYDTFTGTGNLRGSGLPFNSESVTNEFWQFNVWASNLTWAANTYLQTYGGTVGSNKITFNRISSGAGANVVPVDAVSQIIVSGYYKTA